MILFETVYREKFEIKNKIGDGIWDGLRAEATYTCIVLLKRFLSSTSRFC
jgi:hypothetical protein